MSGIHFPNLSYTSRVEIGPNYGPQKSSYDRRVLLLNILYKGRGVKYEKPSLFPVSQRPSHTSF